MSVKDEIKKMFVAFDVNPDTAKIKAAVFVEDLAEYNQDDVAEAIKKARKSCKFCPRVADIIEFLEPSEEDITLEAGDYADKAINAVMFSQEYDLGDDIANLTLKQMGFFEWKQRSDHDFKTFFKPSFIKTYKMLKNSKESNLMLEDNARKSSKGGRINSKTLSLSETVATIANGL